MHHVLRDVKPTDSPVRQGNYMSADLTEVIENSLEDSQLTGLDDSTIDVQPEVDTQVAPEAEVSSEGQPEASEDVIAESQAQVQSPAAKAAAAQALPEDEFEKKFGFPKINPVTGKENRLPHSRVKSMVMKAEQEAANKAKAEYEPKLAEVTAKVSAYESRLGQVAQFEQVMANDPQRFLGMLSQLPAYKPFFDWVAQVQNQAPAQAQQPQGQGQAQDPAGAMPQPDQQLSDGSWVYSMDGLQKLLNWQAQQVEQRVSKRYEPIESQFRQHQQMQQMIPQIQRQIDEARQWPKFNENEEEITKALAADQTLTLEGAYRKVVLPKLVADENAIRQRVLADIRKAPPSTAAPSRATRPPSPAAGPRSLEQIIEDEIRKLGQ